MALDILNHSKKKILLELLVLGLLPIIGITISKIIPSLLFDNIHIQILEFVLLGSLSFTVFKISNLLINGVILQKIMPNSKNKLYNS